MQGRYIPTPENMDIRPVIEQEQALENAALAMKSNTGCLKCRLELVIFAPPAGDPRLAYEIHAVKGLTNRWVFVVDAADGKILQKRSLVKTHRFN